MRFQRQDCINCGKKHSNTAQYQRCANNRRRERNQQINQNSQHESSQNRSATSRARKISELQSLQAGNQISEQIQNRPKRSRNKTIIEEEDDEMDFIIDYGIRDPILIQQIRKQFKVNAQPKKKIKQNNDNNQYQILLSTINDQTQIGKNNAPLTNIYVQPTDKTFQTYNNAMQLLQKHANDVEKTKARQIKRIIAKENLTIDKFKYLYSKSKYDVKQGIIPVVKNFTSYGLIAYNKRLMEALHKEEPQNKIIIIEQKDENQQIGINQNKKKIKSQNLEPTIEQKRYALLKTFQKYAVNQETQHIYNRKQLMNVINHIKQIPNELFLTQQNGYTKMVHRLFDDDNYRIKQRQLYKIQLDTNKDIIKQNLRGNWRYECIAATLMKAHLRCRPNQFNNLEGIYFEELKSIYYKKDLPNFRSRTVFDQKVDNTSISTVIGDIRMDQYKIWVQYTFVSQQMIDFLWCVQRKSHNISFVALQLLYRFAQTEGNRNPQQYFYRVQQLMRSSYPILSIQQEKQRQILKRFYQEQIEQILKNNNLLQYYKGQFKLMTFQDARQMLIRINNQSVEKLKENVKVMQCNMFKQCQSIQTELQYIFYKNGFGRVCHALLAKHALNQYKFHQIQTRLHYLRRIRRNLKNNGNSMRNLLKEQLQWTIDNYEIVAQQKQKIKNYMKLVILKQHHHVQLIGEPEKLTYYQKYLQYANDEQHPLQLTQKQTQEHQEAIEQLRKRSQIILAHSQNIQSLKNHNLNHKLRPYQPTKDNQSTVEADRAMQHIEQVYQTIDKVVKSHQFQQSIWQDQVGEKIIQSKMNDRIEQQSVEQRMQQKPAEQRMQQKPSKDIIEQQAAQDQLSTHELDIMQRYKIAVDLQRPYHLILPHIQGIKQNYKFESKKKFGTLKKNCFARQPAESTERQKLFFIRQIQSFLAAKKLSFKNFGWQNIFDEQYYLDENVNPLSQYIKLSSKQQEFLQKIRNLTFAPPIRFIYRIKFGCGFNTIRKLPNKYPIGPFTGFVCKSQNVVRRMDKINMFTFTEYESKQRKRLQYFMVGTTNDMWSLGPMFNGTNDPAKANIKIIHIKTKRGIQQWIVTTKIIDENKHLLWYYGQHYKHKGVDMIDIQYQLDNQKKYEYDRITHEFIQKIDKQNEQYHANQNMRNQQAMQLRTSQRLRQKQQRERRVKQINAKIQDKLSANRQKIITEQIRQSILIDFNQLHIYLKKKYDRKLVCSREITRNWIQISPFKINDFPRYDVGEANDFKYLHDKLPNKHLFIVTDRSVEGIRQIYTVLRYNDKYIIYNGNLQAQLHQIKFPGEIAFSRFRRQIDFYQQGYASILWIININKIGIDRTFELETLYDNQMIGPKTVFLKCLNYDNTEFVKQEYELVNGKYIVKSDETLRKQKQMRQAHKKKIQQHYNEKRLKQDAKQVKIVLDGMLNWVTDYFEQIQEKNEEAAIATTHANLLKIYDGLKVLQLAQCRGMVETKDCLDNHRQKIAQLKKRIRLDSFQQ